MIDDLLVLISMCVYCVENAREALGLPRDVNPSVSGYAKLERSLMSGLPNEVDFALNVFLLLSTEGKYVLRGVKGMHVIDCMLSHVGISRDGECPLSNWVCYNGWFVEFGDLLNVIINV